MLDWLWTTDAHWAGLVARVVLGAVILPHGLQKLLGWFGGHGFRGTMGFFTGQMGLPAVLAFLVIMAESLGALGLIFGVFGRFAALGIALVMLGAAWMVHRPHGFFINWFGQKQGEGYEFHLLAAGMALVVLVLGSGALSVDLWLTRVLST